MVRGGSGRAATCWMGRYPTALYRHAGIAVPGFQTMNRPEIINVKSPRGSQPLFRAAQFEEFLRLQEHEHFTLTAAARAIGLSASTVSGPGSMLVRYLRGGLAGLERQGGSGAGASDLCRRIEALGWFIPAAQFFYWSANRRRGALAKAVRRAAALPTLPCGWRKETHARFLARLGADAAPECPADLREELSRREREKKPIVSGRIARLVTVSPLSMRRYAIEAPVAELSQIPFAAIISRLAELQPDGTCSLTIELL
jgi:hypothetical protein